ncbi:MAG: hypothetical protein WKF30_03890 [Pyrinomonadaceae bacterium]
MGLSGSSSGLEIARRFGLPPAVIAAAANRVAAATREAAKYLQRIKREADEAHAQRLAIEEERRRGRKVRRLDAEARAAERERQKNFERALHKATEEFDRRARELYANIEDRALRAKVEREARQSGRVAPRIEKAVREQQAQPRPQHGEPASTRSGDVRVIRRGQSQEAPEASAERREIKAGDQVRLITVGGAGVVERVGDGEAEVRVGSLRFRRKSTTWNCFQALLHRHRKARAARARQNSARGTEFICELQAEPDAELNLIGRRRTRRRRGRQFLDEAYLHSYGQVRIIHGHGTERSAARSQILAHPSACGRLRAGPAAARRRRRHRRDAEAIN